MQGIYLWRIGIVLAAALFSSFGHAAAPRSRLVGVDQFMRAPALYSPQISPDGNWVASLRPSGGRSAIFIESASGGRPRLLYRDPDRTVESISWSGDGRYILFPQDVGGNEAFHLYRVSAEPSSAGAPLDLTPFAGVTAELVAVPRAQPHTGVITLNRRNPSLSDAYRLDVASGQLELAAENDGHMTSFLPDAYGRVLAAVGTRADGVLELMARKDEAAPWRIVYAAPVSERFNVLRLHPSRFAALVRSNGGGEREQLYWLQLDTGQRQPLAASRCGRFDAGDALLADDGAELAQTCVETRSRIEPSSPVIGRAISALNARNKSVEFVSRSDDARRIVFYINASNDPGRYVLYDDKTRQRRLLGLARPWLDGKRLAVSRPYWIKARDGLPLLVYLTRPAVKVASKAPLLVLVHGGPWTRDTGDFSGEVQTWANRGYAVLQVNFRGSTGFGKKHFRAGVGEFGRAMVDDVMDGVNWAQTRPGIADRACVVGGSYGGYATLVALTRYADRFACGVDYAGPADLVTLVESFPPPWKPFLPRSWHQFVGDPAIPAQRAAMTAQSPIHFMDNVRAPIMIFQGANDPRVTQAQSDAVVQAFCARGLEVSYLVSGSEGHSFGNEETAVGVTRAAEVFLGRHLHGLVQDRATAGAETARLAMTRVPCKK